MTHDSQPKRPARKRLLHKHPCNLITVNALSYIWLTRISCTVVPNSCQSAILCPPASLMITTSTICSRAASELCHTCRTKANESGVKDQGANSSVHVLIMLNLDGLLINSLTILNARVKPMAREAVCSFFRDSSTDKKAIMTNGLTVKSNANINIKLHTRHYYVLASNL